MAISLHLDEMSVEEKLQAMESLWEDLCSRADSMASPAWHGEALADREAAIDGGNDHFQDWEVAKQDIENTIS